jgi:hypothetical protein
MKNRTERGVGIDIRCQIRKAHMYMAYQIGLCMCVWAPLPVSTRMEGPVYIYWELRAVRIVYRVNNIDTSPCQARTYITHMACLTWMRVCVCVYIGNCVWYTGGT